MTIRSLSCVRARVEQLTGAFVRAGCPVCREDRAGPFPVVQRLSVDQVIKVRRADQRGYIEIAAKYFGILVEQVQVTGVADLEVRIAAVRQGLAAAKAKA